MLKSLLWPWEVGRALGLSARTVCRLADAGEVNCIRDGRGRRRFRPDAVAQLREKLGIQELEAGPRGGGTAA
jgi:hypothetical protein